jgi:hypothetical protein
LRLDGEKQLGALRTLEREHARRLEAQHVALRVEKALEFRRKFDLADDNAVARDLRSGGLDRSDVAGSAWAQAGVRHNPTRAGRAASSVAAPGSPARMPATSAQSSTQRAKSPTVSKLPASGLRRSD